MNIYFSMWQHISHIALWILEIIPYLDIYKEAIYKC